MITIFIAICTSACLNLLLQFVNAHYTYNVALILLIVEISKLLLCLLGMLCISRQRNCPVRFGFIVNSVLYAVVNYLSHYITKTIPVSIYSVLIQHKLVWIVFFSILILKKSFTKQQYCALIAVCSGCILTKMTDDSMGDVAKRQMSTGLLLIALQGICSSLSSVWIEKMMKVTERPLISENYNKLYWFLADSFQMYLFAIPIYATSYVLGFGAPVITTLSLEATIIVILLSILNGMILGAVFVYHSSVIRSIIAAIVIVILAIEHNIYSIPILSGIGLVLLGVIGWTI